MITSYVYTRTLTEAAQEFIDQGVAAGHIEEVGPGEYRLTPSGLEHYEGMTDGQVTL